MSNPDQSPANSPLQARALELHTKASMPLSQSEELALSELGLDDAAIDELSAEACCTVLLTLLDAEDVRAFTRAILVHQPAATSTQAVAPTEAAAMAATVPEVDREALTDLIAEQLRGTYHCGRVWHAWSVGTMGEDDFSPVEESDTPAELADEIIAKFARGIAAPISEARVKEVYREWLNMPGAANEFDLIRMAAKAAIAPQAPVAGQPAAPSEAEVLAAAKNWGRVERYYLGNGQGTETRIVFDIAVRAGHFAMQLLGRRNG